MADYEKYLDSEVYQGDLHNMAKEIFHLRMMIWLNHGHKGMYGDDGEMQCSQCVMEYGFWDWKRTSIKEIQSKMTTANLKKLAEQGKGKS